MRTIRVSVVVALATLSSGCTIVRTTAAVTGAVVSTTAVVAGAAVKGTARAVSSIGEDDDEASE